MHDYLLYKITFYWSTQVNVFDLFQHFAEEHWAHQWFWQIHYRCAEIFKRVKNYWFYYYMTESLKMVSNLNIKNIFMVSHVMTLSNLTLKWASFNTQQGCFPLAAPKYTLCWNTRYWRDSFTAPCSHSLTNRTNFCKSSQGKNTGKSGTSSCIYWSCSTISY